MTDELEWWQSLDGEDQDINTAGVPPYELEPVVDRLDAFLPYDRPIPQFPGLVGESIILDLGCGYGRLTKALAKRRTGRLIYGADPSSKLIYRAHRESRHENIVWRVTDGRRIPPVPFDGAYSITVLQHLPHDLVRSYLQQVAERCPRFIFTVQFGTEDAFASHQIEDLDQLDAWLLEAGFAQWFTEHDRKTDWWWVEATR